MRSRTPLTMLFYPSTLVQKQQVLRPQLLYVQRSLRDDRGGGSPAPCLNYPQAAATTNLAIASHFTIPVIQQESLLYDEQNPANNAILKRHAGSETASSFNHSSSTYKDLFEMTGVAVVCPLLTLPTSGRDYKVCRKEPFPHPCHSAGIFVV